MAFNTEAVRRGCSYRIVLGNIVRLAEGKLNDMFPKLTREQRIILAQTEPLLTACKDDRQPTDKEFLEITVKNRKPSNIQK